MSKNTTGENLTCRTTVCALVREHAALLDEVLELGRAVSMLRSSSESSEDETFDRLEAKRVANLDGYEHVDDSHWLSDARKDKRKSVQILLGEYLQKRTALIAFDRSVVNAQREEA
jgi:hypothetical protein